MNDPSLVPAPSTPLAGLVEAHFAELELERLLGPVAASLGRSIWGRALEQPLSDFASRAGKEFRQNLVRTSFAIAGGEEGACPGLLPLLVEILHAGSLIVDDIQDESTTRRGAPALHVTYGVPVALNVGNWMYFWALALVERLPLDAGQQLCVMRTTSRLLLACHHGQALDLTANVCDLSQRETARVVHSTAELKTGALLELAARLGAIAAHASEEREEALGRFGRNVGIALQMLDDLGGLLSERRRDKGNEDLRLGRPTWPFAWLASELSAQSYAELRALSRRVQQSETEPEILAQELVRQLNGQGRIRVHGVLGRALRELRAAVGDVPVLDRVQRELRRLEKSYV